VFLGQRRPSSRSVMMVSGIRRNVLRPHQSVA
jgi:hypothetical protein